MVGAVTPVEVSSRAFWSATASQREERFAVLRERAPVSWQPPVQDALLPDPDDPGYWAVVRHADVVDVSRRPDVFVSGRGVMFDTVPPRMLAASQSILAMDAPQHTRVRRLVSAAFTPRRIRSLEAAIRDAAAEIVDDLAVALDGGGAVDFVHHCAARLPLRLISDLMGLPPELREPVAEAAVDTVTFADPTRRAGRSAHEMITTAQAYLHATAAELATRRRADPGDDLLSALACAEVPGDDGILERLDDAEIAAFFVLLAVAGNDTTRQTASHAVHALTRFPAQRAWLAADLEARLPRAVDEFVRWATPVMTFRRTAVTDTEIAGQPIAAGDKVVMFYASANADPAVFDRPRELDLARDPNPHVGFGGGGPHFCLGTHLARTQLRALFAELLTRLPTITAGEPTYVPTNFVHAIRELPVTA